MESMRREYAQPAQPRLVDPARRRVQFPPSSERRSTRPGSTSAASGNKLALLCASIPPAGPSSGGSLVLASLRRGSSAWADRGAALRRSPCFFLFFFRDPESTDNAPDLRGALAGGRPRDGRGRRHRDGVPAGRLAADQHLSVADGRAREPDAGRRARDEGGVSSRPFPAGLPGRGGDLNEYTEVTIDHDGQPIVVRQIVGILARRIVCRIKEGDEVKAGDGSA